ncbi:uncharacterized protein BJ212DRAFT_1418610 [Suillus subaureus]|uniref:Uncharacterized protein n=1 Tax=Suillus subaureus TaxID=48587 RepID=A0A9P7DGD2_9AGAM|nr:uncharacterized protein BJ212DRAFT_1418610 [Suillus subaureus]KAG1791782.1 hypothetical protein BJ212DRAFT_1418610 [Suillus subaureus]
MIPSIFPPSHFAFFRVQTPQYEIDIRYFSTSPLNECPANHFVPIHNVLDQGAQ